jgi:hypothetical protein
MAPIASGLDPSGLRNLVSNLLSFRQDINIEEVGNTPTARGLFETGIDGFDLNILFGGRLDQSKKLTWDNSDVYNTQTLITEPTNKTNTVATGVKLIGVSIMGQAKAITDEGRGIVETYTFQAKDLQTIMPKLIKNTKANKTQS